MIGREIASISSHRADATVQGGEVQRGPGDVVGEEGQLYHGKCLLEPTLPGLTTQRDPGEPKTWVPRGNSTQVPHPSAKAGRSRETAGRTGLTSSNLARQCDPRQPHRADARGWRTFGPVRTTHSRARSQMSGSLEAVVFGEKSRFCRLCVAHAPFTPFGNSQTRLHTSRACGLDRRRCRSSSSSSWLPSLASRRRDPGRSSPRAARAA